MITWYRTLGARSFPRISRGAGLAAATVCLVAATVSLATTGLLLTATVGLADTSLPAKIDEIVAAEARYDLFSGVVLVAQDGEIIYSRGVGEANREYGIPNSLATKYNIGSIQKCFIATAVMQLVQSGDITLTDSLTRFYPDCPWPVANEIQIRHLLNHSSGLGDYRDSEHYQAHSEEFENIDEVLPLVYESEPAFEPGDAFRYSNSGVLLVKGILERVTGQSLEEILTERIFRPLRMDDTVLFVGGDVLANRATGHQRGSDGETIVRVLGESSGYAGGGIHTTALDLLKFDQALYGEQLLDAEHKRIMFTPSGPRDDVAYGWFVEPIGETTAVTHSGGSGGFQSELRRYPERGITIIVMANYAGAGFELTNAIEALLLGLPYEVATETDSWFRKGMDLQQAERYARAIACFEKNTQGSEPHLPSLYQAARSRILAELEPAEAVALLDCYIQLADESTSPSIAAAYWRQGVAHEQRNDLTAARACYQTSLEHDPAFSLALQALAKLDAPPNEAP